MLELAQLVHQIATHPTLLAEPATLKALLAATHLSPQELKALLEVLKLCAHELSDHLHPVGKARLNAVLLIPHTPPPTD